MTPRACVLVIDDELIIRESMRMVLGEHYRIIEADCAAAGIEQSEANCPDAFLIDIGLPGEMDGFDCATELIRKGGVNPRRIVFITGLPEGWRNPLPGVSALLGKPFNVSELKEAVARAVAG